MLHDVATPPIEASVGDSAYAVIDEPSVNAGREVYCFLDARFRWIAGHMAVQ
jgi:hypothetical protein